MLGKGEECWGRGRDARKGKGMLGNLKGDEEGGMRRGK